MSANPLAPSWLAPPVDANALAPAVWSQNARRDNGGEVVVAGVPASAIVAEFGTPVYVLDEADVRNRATTIRESFEREFARAGSAAKVYYAGKAFLSAEVARWVTECGLHIDVASGGKLAVALAAGVDAGRLGFHGNNKSLSEIDRAVNAGIGTIVIDSVVEIERVAEAASRYGRTQAVRLRVTSGVHASTHEYLATAREDQKFGIPLADAAAAVARIRSHDSLEFRGLHSHIGSQIFESDGFAEAARRMLAVHAELLEGGPVPELNLGGGFGIAYTSADAALDVDELAASFADIVSSGAAELGIPVPVVAIEPGRAVIGPAGTTLYTVGTIKDVLVTDEPAREKLASAENSVESGNGRLAVGGAVRRYVSVDGGMSDNIRPALYGADYSARIVSRNSAAEPALARVVGKHCESGDILVHAEYLPSDIRPGDVLGIPATGAYCWSLSNNYNYLARPPVVAVLDGEARLIVRGESEADLLGRDLGIRS